MKAKYSHYGNECIIYDTIILEDNAVITIRSYQGRYVPTEPDVQTKICYTQEDAKEFFNEICEEFEKQHYDCEYKEK